MFRKKDNKEVPIRRCLSASYVYNNERTCFDPDSFVGEEREARHKAVKRDLVGTHHSPYPAAWPQGLMYKIFSGTSEETNEEAQELNEKAVSSPYSFVFRS